MTDAPDPADFAYLAVRLPEEPPRRPLGAWGSDVRRAAFSVAFPAAIYLPVATWREAQRAWGWGGVAAVVALFGLGILPVVLSARLRRGRLEAARRLRPAEPWLGDHDWDPAGASLSPGARLLLRAERIATLSPFAFVVLSSLVAGLTAGGFYEGLAVLGGALGTWAAWTAWKFHGAGTSRVSFPRFPFYPGGTVTLHVGTSEGGASFRRAEFRLRRVDEKPHGRWGLVRTTSVAFELRASRPPGPTPGPEQDVPVSFDVPPEAGGTSLSGRATSYWVLDVVANTSAGPYAESFLVPIYERPAA